MAFITNSGGQNSSVLIPVSAAALPSTAAVLMGILPQGAILTSVSYDIATADAATVSIGTASSAAAFASATTLAAGRTTYSPTGTQVGQWQTASATGDVNLYAKASAAVTTGVGAIMVSYRYPAP